MAAVTVALLGFAPAAFATTGSSGLSTPPAATATLRLAEANGATATTGATGTSTSPSIPLNQPIDGVASTPDGKGYWMIAGDGGVFAYGDAGFYGSAGNLKLVKPVVGMAANTSGNGYWLVASDGGIFTYGHAGFYGSAGNLKLVKPVVGMAANPNGNGYWLVASDGGIFTYGTTGFYGSAGNLKLVKPIVGMTPTPDGRGYWLVASDGGIFTYGDAGFYGSAGGMTLSKPIVGMTATPDGNGYWLVGSDGTVLPFGDAGSYASPSTPSGSPVVGVTSAITNPVPVASGSSNTPPPGTPTTTTPTGATSAYTFDDEFSGPAGAGPNTGMSQQYWRLQGCWTVGCGNQSPTQYSANNAYLDGDGDLVLEADRGSSASCGFGPCEYTSAGLSMTDWTNGGNATWSQTYGTFSARIKLPTGAGLWPAFWMAGANGNVVAWPNNGEIDVMEAEGTQPGTILQHIEGPGTVSATNAAANSTSSSSSAVLRAGGARSLPAEGTTDGWHVYSVTWTPDGLSWSIDGVQTMSMTATQVGAAWGESFQHPFDMILDLTVGGNLPGLGTPDASTVFPAKMLVDWVRVTSP